MNKGYTLGELLAMTPAARSKLVKETKEQIIAEAKRPKLESAFDRRVREFFEQSNERRWREQRKFGPPAPEPIAAPDRSVDTTNGMWSVMGDEMAAW